MWVTAAWAPGMRGGVAGPRPSLDLVIPTTPPPHGLPWGEEKLLARLGPCVPQREPGPGPSPPDGWAEGQEAPPLLPNQTLENPERPLLPSRRKPCRRQASRPAPPLGQRAQLGPAPRPSPPDGRLSSLPPSAPATFPSPCPFLGGFPKQRWAPGRPGTRVVNLQATHSTILQPTPVSAAEGPLNTCRDRPPPDRDSARHRLSATHAPDVEPAARRGSGLLEVSEPARGGALGHRHTLRSGPEHAPAIVPKTRPRPGPRCLTDTGRPRGSPQARPRPAPGFTCCST